MSLSSVALLLLATCFLCLAVLEALASRGTARNDSDTSGRAITNFGLALAVMLSTAFPSLTRMGASSVAADHDLGWAHIWSAGWLPTFVLTLILQSMAAYWVHRMFHAVPLFWRVHRVHHTDKHLDISTGLRNHPLELAVTIPVSIAVVMMIGAPISVVVAVDTLLFAGALWQHADLSLPPVLERGLGAVFVTPDLHRSHHVPERSVHDGNYGDIFILWDRLFGTARPKSPLGTRFGLDHQRARHDDLIGQLLAPLDSLDAEGEGRTAGQNS